MAALPKKKSTRSRTGKRRAKSYTVILPTLSKCKNCGKPKLPHQACPSCGVY